MLLKITDRLDPNTEASFSGRRLRNNGDSVDILMRLKYIEELLDLYGVTKSNSSPTTGSSSLKRIVEADAPSTDSEHSEFRTAVGKLLWLAFVRPDCSYAVKELNRDVKSNTFESLAKLKHLLRYLSGSKPSVLRLRPSQTLSGWKRVLGIQCFADSDWAGCSQTRQSTSGSIVQVLDCDILHSSRTQATVALSSGEAEMDAIGPGINNEYCIVCQKHRC